MGSPCDQPLRWPVTGVLLKACSRDSNQALLREGPGHVHQTPRLSARCDQPLRSPVTAVMVKTAIFSSDACDQPLRWPVTGVFFKTWFFQSNNFVLEQRPRRVYKLLI